MPFDVALLGSQTVVDPDGGEHQIGDLWADSPAVLLFLRHFG